jgi:sugar/nucleoside kinase (ribokinase family)/fructoselysine-6-P-deglycase FrlB-like protein
VAKSILGAGMIAVDHIFLSSKVRDGDLEYLGSSGGGTVPNTLCLLSLLGYDTHIFGLIGNDFAGSVVKQEFRRFGIDSDNLVKREDCKRIISTRQFSHLILPNGFHTFKKQCLACKSSFGREFQISKTDLSEKAKRAEQLAAQSDLLILDRSNNATYALAQIASANNRKIAYDLSFTSYGKYRERLESILKLCSLVKVNNKTFKKIVGSADNLAIMKWREVYPNVDFLIITDGENGVSGFANINGEKTIFSRKAIKCSHVVDPSGAGDIVLAMLASEIVLSNPPVDLVDFEERLDHSQALASLNCALYGARALQRTYLNQKASPNEILESARLIVEKGSSGNSFSPRIGMPKQVLEPYKLAYQAECKVCGKLSNSRRSALSKPKRIVFSQKDSESLSRVPWTMQSSFNTGRRYSDKILNLVNQQNAIFVGSGGSFTAATFGEALFLHTLGRLSKAITPYEFEGLKSIDKENVVWFISHGGGNTDILGAALHAQAMSHRKCVVLTGNKNSKLVEIAKENNWTPILASAEERDFVSVIGLLSQVSTLCGLLASDEELNSLKAFFSEDNLRKRFNSSMREMQTMANELAPNPQIVKNTHIVAFARGWGWPALVDLESKITEGGICTIEISELKNFTHGRYINLFDRPNRRVVLIETPNDRELVDYLDIRFRKYIPTYRIETEDVGISGAVDLLIKALSLALHLGHIAKQDILRPQFPKQARGLYSWEPSSRKGYWKTNQKWKNEQMSAET